LLNEDNAFDSEKLSKDVVEDIKIKVCKVLTREQAKSFLKIPENYEKITSAKQEIKFALKRIDPKNSSI